MKRITIWSMVAVVLVITAVIVVRADGRGWRGWPGHGWHHAGPLHFLGHELHLSDAQQAQVRTLWQLERPTVSAHIKEFLAEDKEMNALTAQENPDQGRMQEIADREATTIAALLVEKEKLQSKIYTKVLNPGQRAKADELRKKWESRLDHAADRLGTQPAEK